MTNSTKKYIRIAFYIVVVVVIVKMIVDSTSKDALILDANGNAVIAQGMAVTGGYRFSAKTFPGVLRYFLG